MVGPGVGKVLLTSATLDPPSDRNAGENRFPAFEREVGIREEDRQSRFNVRVEPSRFGRLAFRLADRTVPRPGREDEDGGFESDPAWLDYTAGMVKAAMAEKARASVGADGNRVLVLTTSYTDAEALAARVDGLEAHRRGTKLDGYVDAFKRNPVAALVTPAGWSGLNLPGLVKHLVVARLPFAPPNPVEDDLLRALLAARGMGGREIDGILMVRRMEETRRRLRQGLGRAIRAPEDAATVWIGDPRFPLPDELVRDRRARVSQGLAAPFTSFIATIPARFREKGMWPAWDEAGIHDAGRVAVAGE
jgi:ATP-dependent DNA helicase DinG